MQSTKDDERKIDKLERQIAEFERELTIEAKEQDLIKVLSLNYSELPNEGGRLSDIDHYL